MSSYWLKIASRAEAKNRLIYKPRRFTETRCTYAAVAGKVGALRETHRERDCERAAALFLSVPRHGEVFHKNDKKNGKAFSFSASVVWVLLAGGGGCMTISFLPQQVMFFSAFSQIKASCVIFA